MRLKTLDSLNEIAVTVLVYAFLGFSMVGAVCVLYGLIVAAFSFGGYP